jgi:putative membrane protein insertion efficiency factor
MTMVSPSFVSKSKDVRSLVLRVPASTLKMVIRGYQLVHPAFFNGSCRFYPTCSHYAFEAIETHGAVKGSLLAANRILRCQPLCKGGFDPVPPRDPQNKPGQKFGRKSQAELGNPSLSSADSISF